ncbi:unnamed protein product [marine sediment metagenome]|uniref:Carbohydrate kinase PfkB domain-containing protein n=1 Tax=marine sediment metagenome TaxID=412755 RepID=X0RUE5_9ZZZZ
MDKKELITYLDKIKDLRVLVVGETIIDEYQYGYTLGKAGKFPIVAFQNEKLEIYDGGIIAICNHLSDFCKVDYITDIEPIVKKRYVQNSQKLFETYSKETPHYYSIFTILDDCNNINYWDCNYEDYDLVIVADFGHGFITKEMRKKILQESNYIALNTQFNAGNLGMNTINKYEYADYICIDEHELRLATSNQYGNIEDIIKNRFTEQIVSITLSSKGTVIYKNNEIQFFDALEHHPVDTVGAGDAYFAITSPLAYLDAPLDVIGYVGNVVGAIACSYQGNKESITKEKLISKIKEIKKNDER